MKIRTKRVLFITSSFPRSEKDTQVPWLGMLAKKLKEKGLDIDVFTPAYKGSKSHSYFGIPVFRFRYAPAFFEDLTHGEGAVHKLEKRNWLILIAFLYVFFGSIAIIGRVLQKKYDIIHVHWPFPQGIFGIIAKKISKGRLIFNFYSAEFALIEKIPFGISLLSLLTNSADEVLSISNYTREQVEKICTKTITIIPFAAAVERSSLQIKKKGESVKNLLFVGRLIERKGVIYLIKALALLPKDISVHLHIVGVGPLVSQYKKTIQDLNLEETVSIHENVTDEQLPKYYKNADLFILPSIVDNWGDTEGLGVVLLEAMSFGVPVIATSVGGIPDIIDNKVNGILVKQKSPEELARSIEEVLRNTSLQKKLIDNGTKTIAKTFNWNNIIEKTIAVYNSI